MERGLREMTLSYKGESVTFDMPGWYGEPGDPGIHTDEDLKVSLRALHLLKNRHQRLAGFASEWEGG
jgi:HTH-type transcriptional regulator/antitoxin MqsA